MKNLVDYKNRLEWLKKTKKFSFYFDDEFFINNTSYVKNSKKGKGKITNYKVISPLSVEYWKARGIVDRDEIEKLRKPYLDKCTNRLSRYIEKYGEEI